MLVNIRRLGQKNNAVHDGAEELGKFRGIEEGEKAK